MKKYLFLIMIVAAAIVFAGCDKNTPDVYEADDAPSYAASKTVWQFGNRTWSDAIQMPECDKKKFTMTFDSPECRSHVAGTTQWFYYNWQFMNVYRKNLCPHPWRLPTRDDVDALIDATNSAVLAAEWGLSGYAHYETVRVLDSLGCVRVDCSASTGDCSVSIPNKLTNLIQYGTVNNPPMATYGYAERGFTIRCIR